jgi:hypothetical protein
MRPKRTKMWVAKAWVLLHEKAPAPIVAFSAETRQALHFVVP